MRIGAYHGAIRAGILLLSSACFAGCFDPSSAYETDGVGATGQDELCGNGIVDVGEECDAHGHSACLPGCRLQRCGDGYVWPGHEECDDANLQSGDGCSAACELESPADTTDWGADADETGHETFSRDTENSSISGTTSGSAEDPNESDTTGASDGEETSLSSTEDGDDPRGEQAESSTGEERCNCRTEEGSCVRDGEPSPDDACRVCDSAGGRFVALEAGAECGTRSMCLSGRCTEVRRVFTTRVLLDVSALASGEAADSTCVSSGRAVDEDATWLAWFAGGVVDPPLIRFERFDGPYVNQAGAVVANSWDALVTVDFDGNNLGAPMNVDEFGRLIEGSTVQGERLPSFAWTGVDYDGSATLDSCGGWSFTSTGRITGIAGDLYATDGGWTRSTALNCTSAAHLYCFEQGEL